MVAEGVVFVLGHACSHAAIAASKVYEQAGILYMAASATNPKLTEEGGPNVFRLRGRDDRWPRSPATTSPNIGATSRSRSSTTVGRTESTLPRPSSSGSTSAASKRRLMKQ